MVTQLTQGILAAIIVTALGLIPLNKIQSSKLKSRLSIVVLTLGYLVGHVLVFELPSIPITGAAHYLFWVALLCCGFAGLDRRFTPESLLWPLLQFTLLLILLLLLLYPMFVLGWTLSEGLSWLLGTATAFFVLWVFYERLEKQGTIRVRLFLFCLMNTSSAVLAAATGSLLLGQLLGVLAAITGVLWLFSNLKWLPTFSLRLFLYLEIPILLGLLAQAHFYSETPLNSILVLLAIPLVLFLEQPLSRWTKKTRWIELGLAFALVAIAFSFASQVMMIE